MAVMRCAEHCHLQMLNAVLVPGLWLMGSMATLVPARKDRVAFHGWRHPPPTSTSCGIQSILFPTLCTVCNMVFFYHILFDVYGM